MLPVFINLSVSDILPTPTAYSTQTGGCVGVLLMIYLYLCMDEGAKSRS